MAKSDEISGTGKIRMFLKKIPSESFKTPYFNAFKIAFIQSIDPEHEELLRAMDVKCGLRSTPTSLDDALDFIEKSPTYNSFKGGKVLVHAPSGKVYDVGAGTFELLAQVPRAGVAVDDLRYASLLPLQIARRMYVTDVKPESLSELVEAGVVEVKDGWCKITPVAKKCTYEVVWNFSR